MYVQGNPRTKTELRKRIEEGETVGVFQPNDMFNRDFTNYTGWCSVEGPHYPQPHKWYARVRVENGRIVSVK